MDAEEYKKAITDAVKRHMLITGADVAVSLARRIGALTIAENGDVLRIQGNPATAFAALKNGYASFLGDASRIILRPLNRKYPDIFSEHQ